MALIHTVSFPVSMSVLPSNRLGIDVIIIPMGTDKTYEHDAMLLRDGYNQAIAVALHVEHHAVLPDDAGIAIGILDIRRGSPRRPSGIGIPCFQRGLCVRMPFPELAQGTQSDHAHNEILS